MVTDEPQSTDKFGDRDYENLGIENYSYYKRMMSSRGTRLQDTICSGAED